MTSTGGAMAMSKYRHHSFTEPEENRQHQYVTRQTSVPSGFRSGSRGSMTWTWGARKESVGSDGGGSRKQGGEILKPPEWLKRNMSSGRLDIKTQQMGDYLKEQRQAERKQRHLELKRKRVEARRSARTRTPGCDFDEESDEDDVLTPYVRFRRAARCVRMLIHACKVCKESLVYSLMDESWYQMIGDLVQEAERNVRPHGKSFVTFVANENHELEQLEFDVGEFKRDYNKSDDLLTDEIKETLQLRPEIRTPEQINEAVKCLKKINQEFRSLTLDAQKKIAGCSFYDKYFQQRVILRQGLPPDGLYYVLSGSLIERGANVKNPMEFRPGDKFGEEDLTCGCSRRSTIVTKATTELLYLHKEDYMEIFNMAVDSTDPKNLDICKKDIVFSHYPMQKLIDNPGTWSVLRYKFGRLIVKDSNDMESIYVIKSGEARVIKHLQAETVDVKARRKKIQGIMQAEDNYHQTRKLLDFVSERTYVQSHYRPAHYKPRVGLKSAPARLTNGHSKYSYNKFRHTISGLPDLNNNNRTKMIRSQTFADFGSKIPEAKSAPVESNSAKDDSEIITKIESDEKKESGRLRGIKEVDERSKSAKPKSTKLPSLNNEKPGVLLQLVAKNRPTSTEGGPTYKEQRKRIVFRRQKSSQEKNFNEDCIYFGKDNSGSHVPPFVQLESLHAGKVFGLRSCLPANERGPSASLVSAGCEILQINKNYFSRHLDENLENLIKFKSKAYPSEEELVDRLDINLQWDEFKKEAMKTVLEECQIDVEKRWADHSTAGKKLTKRP